MIIFFKDSCMDIFANSVKSWSTPTSLQFFFPKQKEGYFKNFDINPLGFNGKF